MIAFGILLYIALAFYIVKWVWQKKRSVSLTAFTVIIILLLASWDNIIGNIMFNRVCKEEGGERISKTVENVDGVMMDAPDGCYGICLRALLEKRYKFIEVNVIKPQKSALTTETGLHRFYLDKRGSEDCTLYEEYYEKRENNKDYFLKQYPYEYCIASKKANEAKSRYIYLWTAFDINYMPAWNISKSESNVKDINTGEILGTYKVLYYYGGWIARKFEIWGPLMSAGSSKCPKDNATRWDLVFKVLRPKQ